MQNNPTIVWEKWVDPYGNNPEDIEWPGYDSDHIIDDHDEESEHKPKVSKINAIVTSMGIIPFNEHTDCSKIFNFWVGHTNFSITQYIAHILQSIEGVETLDIFTRYRFRIAFGKAFDDRQVMDTINSKIKTLFITNANESEF
jgi:hypothetical protein